jgi:tetratricopeptide (TPR) repeat protein
MAKSLTRKNAKKLDEIYDLINEGQFEDALAESLALTRKHAKLVEGWQALFEVSHNIDDNYHMWTALNQLCQLDPGNDDNFYNLAVILMQMGFFFMSKQTAAIYLKRFPDGLHIDKVTQLNETLADAIQQMQAEGEIEPDVSVDDMALFEKGNLLVSSGQYQLGRKVSRQAAKKLPDSPSPLNNVSLSYMAEGNLVKAIQSVEDVLSTHPDNLFARSTKVQLLVRLGREDEAHELIETLSQESPENTDHWLKIMEACAVAHAHQMVVDVYERAIEQSEYPLGAHEHQMAGTAYAFLGQPEKAVALWQKALNTNPHLQVAAENIQQFEEHGPWYLPLHNWMPRPWIEKLLRAFERGPKQVKRLYAKNPEIETALSLMLERGSPDALELALRVAEYYPVTGLVSFASGRRGTDQQRMEAAQLATEHGLVSRTEPFKLFIEGESHEVMLLSFTIDSEPVERDDPLPDDAQEHMENTYYALSNDEYERAMQEVEKGLAIVPGDRVLLHYKSNVLKLQGQKEESEAIIRRLAEDYPDYLFARTAMAEICIEEDKLDEAKEWFDPLLSQQQFHTSEFRSLAFVQVKYWYAKKEPQRAKYWVEMLEQIDPDSVPESWREANQLLGLLDKLKGLDADQS